MSFDRAFALIWSVIAATIAIVCVRELLRIGLAEGGATVTTIGGIVFAAAMLISGWKTVLGSRLAILTSICLSVLGLLYSLSFVFLIGERFGGMWLFVAVGAIVLFASSTAFLIRRLRAQRIGGDR